jgi:hypothetical protein
MRPPVLLVRVRVAVVVFVDSIATVSKRHAMQVPGAAVLASSAVCESRY